MREALWNNVIWVAIDNCKNLDIDEMFYSCENAMRELGAPQKEIDLRLFALALYCDKINNLRFFKSTAFLRFANALNYYYFECITQRLIKENNLAFIVFWTVFRLSFAKSLTYSNYLLIEKKMREKSLELGTNFVYLQPNAIGNIL